jgi:hypothetical protein
VPKEPSGDLRVEPLASAHDRSHFVCGVESLDFYLRTQAGQDIRRKANAVFVLVRAAQPKDVLGYFTLCATALNPHASWCQGIRSSAPL